MARLLDKPVGLEDAERIIGATTSRIAATALQTVMQAWVDREDCQRTTPEGMHRQGRRAVWVRSLWGDFRIRRAYYTGPLAGQGGAPADRGLGLWSSYTPATARTLAKLSAQLPFESAAQLLHDMSHATINARQFQRFLGEAGQAARAWIRSLKPPETAPETLYVSFDGTGVPMRKEHLEGRKGRGEDGRAKTREMRLGCVFTQTSTDPQGNPLRDPDSTTYVAAIAPHKMFGRMIKDEALRRGSRTAGRVVVISDGAAWCQSIAQWQFPRHLHILDFYHAAEHVQKLAHAVFGQGPPAEEHFKLWREKLRASQAREVIEQARANMEQAENPEDARREVAYLERNLSRMDYQSYSRQGLFIGSGIIEAGCKNVVGKRTKQSGMLWSVKGVHNVITMRCLALSRRIDTFFDQAQLLCKTA